MLCRIAFDTGLSRGGDEGVFSTVELTPPRESTEMFRFGGLRESFINDRGVVPTLFRNVKAKPLLAELTPALN